jgi:hypothetical protein
MLGTSCGWTAGTSWLPWREIARLPVFDNVLPARFSVFTALLAAVIVALWTARSRGPTTIALPALAMLALMPAFWKADYRTTPERWPFFTRSYYKICFPRNENVLVFPYGFWGNSMLWQAESGFWFRMAEGYVQPKPPAYYLREQMVQTLTYVHTPSTDDPRLLRQTCQPRTHGRDLRQRRDTHGSARYSWAAWRSARPASTRRSQVLRRTQCVRFRSATQTDARAKPASDGRRRQAAPYFVTM